MIGSDYASIDTQKGSFYYGYEDGQCKDCGYKTHYSECDKCGGEEIEWCFSANFGSDVFSIPFSKLGTDDMFNVVDNLHAGIGLYLIEAEKEKQALLSRVKELESYIANSVLK